MIASRRHLILLAGLFLCLLGVIAGADSPPALFHAQGEMAGEVRATSVLLQSRLTATPGLKDEDVPGARGWGKFQIAEKETFSPYQETEWREAKPENDFILRQQISSLKPGREYYYRLVYGTDRTRTQTGPVRRFRTLAAADQSVPVRFVVGNCMNYAFFMHGPRNDDQKARKDVVDRQRGYPAMEAIRKLGPDFYIGAGDNVYYDHPAKTAAKTLPEMRRKWHEQFVLPRVVEMVGSMATYWIKDDHDYRYNDADRTGDRAPSHELGVRTFREQMPVVPSVDSKEVTYRTVRCGQWVQLWLVEGRDYRSPNKSPDGPKKTIWGEEQKNWLKQTIQASDAPVKLLITPTPMVGPDDAYKSDNHVNPKGFRHEGEEFFSWLKKTGQNHFYLLTGDRHWHYHSMHPSGYEELSCGALNTENARLGRKPGDPQSTDPDAKVKQLYTDAKPIGGYLLVEVLPARDHRSAQLHFLIQDEWGKQLYANRRMVPRRAGANASSPAR